MAGCLLLYYMSFVAYFRLRVCKLLIDFLTLLLELPFALFLEDSLLFFFREVHLFDHICRLGGSLLNLICLSAYMRF